MELDSQAPIATNGSEYNKLYLLGIIGAIALFFALGLVGILFGAFLGVFFGYFIKKEILKQKCRQLRKSVKFVLYSPVPYPDMVAALSAQLSSLGMSVEVNKDGMPVITHNKVIYDISYNNDSTFTIWWRKSIANAILSDNYIKLYRNCVVSMGIIGYHVQQISKAYMKENSD